MMMLRLIGSSVNPGGLHYEERGVWVIERLQKRLNYLGLRGRCVCHLEARQSQQGGGGRCSGVKWQGRTSRCWRQRVQILKTAAGLP